jgi:NTP pyrophosphatase (non-canonical NTP hydrolase)
MIDFEQYRQDVLRTADEPLPQREQILNCALGLCGEAGEVADIIKKAAFMGHPLDKRKLADELGDVLWYWVLLCDTLGLSAADVVAGNVAKLRQRYPNGFSAERSIDRDPPRRGPESRRCREP